MIRTNLALGLGAVALMLASAASAYAASWTVNPETSSLTFSGTQTGKPFTGQFRRFTSQIELDPADLSNASITTNVDITSFTSGSADRDTDAVAVDWLNAAGFPQAVFASTDIVHEGGDAYRAKGTLSIKGIEKDVELPFTLVIDGDNAIADGAIDLNRMDFKVGYGGEIEDDHFVGHAVQVNLHIEATRAQ